MNLLPDPTPEGIACLDDSYAYALIGRTIHPDGETRFCYSLSKMLKRENVAPAEIFKLVQEVTADLGDRAPLFIDDSVSTEEKVRILGPSGELLN